MIGLYRQIQDGLWLQRVKVPGGRLGGSQWRELGRIVSEQTPGTPLHLTTRQDVEIHNLRPDQIPSVQRALDCAGLTCVGAAGDTPRNITVCPCAGSAPGTVDLMPLSARIEGMLKTVEGIYALPRKFKISLSCGPECGQPWINDLGLVAVQVDGRWGFRVTIAGSLGAKPGTGLLLYDWLPAGDVLPLVLAAVRFFAAHGDRENRRTARLRHVRQRMGDEQFVRLFTAAFDATKGERDWPSVALAPADGTFAARARLTFVNGDISPEAAEAMAALADDPSYRVRIANSHRVIVFGPDESSLQQTLDRSEALGFARRPQPAVVACPGRRWCRNGLAHTNEMADRIRSELADRLDPDTVVCISGCPNGCAHSAVAGVGLSGKLSRRDGKPCEVFDLLVGGEMGRTDKLARPLAPKLRPDDVIAEIGACLAAEGVLQ